MTPSKDRVARSGAVEGGPVVRLASCGPARPCGAAAVCWLCGECTRLQRDAAGDGACLRRSAGNDAA